MNSRRFAWKYSSIVPCRSRWSWLRFVKTSTSKRTRSRRRSAEPCEDASTAALRSPASSISRNSRWRSIASGVVNGAGRRAPPTSHSTVPTRPGAPPGRGEHRAQQERRRRLPVRPGHAGDARAPSSARRRRRRPRRPSTRAHRRRRRAAGRRRRAGARRRARPRRARSPPTRGRGRRPARRGRRRRARPRVTRRVSYARSPISTGLPPATSLGASARIRASSSTCRKARDEGGSPARGREAATCKASGARTALQFRSAAGCGIRRDLEVLQVEARDLAGRPARRRRRPRCRRAARRP